MMSTHTCAELSWTHSALDASGSFRILWFNCNVIRFSFCDRLNKQNSHTLRLSGDVVDCKRKQKERKKEKSKLIPVVFDSNRTQH